MGALNQAQVQAKYDATSAAYDAVLDAAVESFSIEELRAQPIKLQTLREEMSYWKGQLAQFTRTSRRGARVLKMARPG